MDVLVDFDLSDPIEIGTHLIDLEFDLAGLFQRRVEIIRDRVDPKSIPPAGHRDWQGNALCRSVSFAPISRMFSTLLGISGLLLRVYLSEAFNQNNLVRAGVERKFEIIGEALNQATQHYSEQIGLLINNKGAIRQRNVIAHGYFVVDPARLWLSMEKDIPDLATEVETLKSRICQERHFSGHPVLPTE